MYDKYRVQVTNSLPFQELWPIMSDFAEKLISFVVIEDDEGFVLWREFDEDFDNYPFEWVQEVENTPKFNPQKVFLESDFTQINERKGLNKTMAIRDKAVLRNRQILDDFNQLKKQGFSSKHIFSMLGNKYFLSSKTIKDIAYGSKKSSK